MVNGKSLHTGDKVKIVDDWGGKIGQNPDGLMDMWLGKTMTIAMFVSSDQSWMYMVEDNGTGPGGERWVWNTRMIDHIVPYVDEEPLSEDSILSMIFD